MRKERVMHDGVLHGRKKLGGGRGGCPAALSRRAFLASALLCMGTLALESTGCSYDPDDPLHLKKQDAEGSGFASDAITPASQVISLVIYADAYVEQMIRSQNSKDKESYLENFIERYCSQKGRENVSLEVRYTDASELSRMAAEGFPAEADLVICNRETMDVAVDAGVLYSGTAKLSVRDFGYQLPSKIVLCKRKDSKLEMPKARTWNGQDSEDGTATAFKNLAAIKGTIGICGESTYSGRAARQILCTAGDGLYSESSGTGGKFSKKLRKKIVDFDTDADLSRALDAGEVDAAFLLNWNLRNLSFSQGTESLWDSFTSWPHFEGASVVASEKGGYARDFLAYMAQAS